MLSLIIFWFYIFAIPIWLYFLYLLLIKLWRYYLNTFCCKRISCSWNSSLYHMSNFYRLRVKRPKHLLWKKKYAFRKRPPKYKYFYKHVIVFRRYPWIINGIPLDKRFHYRWVRIFYKFLLWRWICEDPFVVWSCYELSAFRGYLYASLYSEAAGRRYFLGTCFVLILLTHYYY